MKRKVTVGIFLAVCMGCLLTFGLSQKLQCTEYYIQSSKISAPVKLAIITDLHSSAYGKDMSELISAVTSNAPDAVLLVGDIFDRHTANGNSQLFVQSMAEKYPCYYVTGNHEIKALHSQEIKDTLRGMGVHVLDGASANLMIHDEIINICGVDDVSIGETVWHEQLTSCIQNIDTSQYTILLSHRPYPVSPYQNINVDLVIAGHAHGGQVRLPGILQNGLYAPDQGWFPKYTTGLSEIGNADLLVSRGLDTQSSGYPRVFNRPELVFLTLLPENH